MTKAVIFGGTTEGRELCGFCETNKIPAIYCAATSDGARAAESMKYVEARAGRLNKDEMAELLKKYKPEITVDATHPYAEEASRNIVSACETASVRYIRVSRENSEDMAYDFYGCIDELIDWLEMTQCNIFVTTGASSAEAFTKLTNWQNRVWMRILPNLDSLKVCLDLGYLPERLICMQGPFSKEINTAMFKNAGAKILVTKDSGAAGGFFEKLRAAKKAGMSVAVLSKPEDRGGVSLAEAFSFLTELNG
jgi:precorrin-6x reductase